MQVMCLPHQLHLLSEKIETDFEWLEQTDFEWIEQVELEWIEKAETIFFQSHLHQCSYVEPEHIKIKIRYTIVENMNVYMLDVYLYNNTRTSRPF